MVQRTLGKYAALSVGVDQVGTWLFSSLSTRLETWNSRGMCKDLSRGMKVYEFADLTTSEFVSEFSEENPNIVWSGRKHLETHEYINEPLDQVKSDSCFQSSDEGPLFCVDLNQSWTVGNLVLSSFIPRVLRTCHIFIGSRLKALGCEQNQTFGHHGVMFMVC